MREGNEISRKKIKKPLDKTQNQCYNKSTKSIKRKEVPTMTKKEMFVEIRNIVADNAEMVAFIDHEIELLDRKSSAPKKPTKVQLENEAFKAEIVSHLVEVDTPKTIKELQAEMPSISGLTNQRITHMLTDLVKAETLVKNYIKKVPYYSVA